MVIAKRADVIARDTVASDALTARGLVDHINDVAQALVDTIGANLPYKCLSKVKRFLRRDCRKPVEMKARDYVNSLMRVNNEEVPWIPPAAVRQSLSDDEIIDIILYGTPKSWRVEMDRQGFDPLDKMIGEVVAFMERIEETEVTSVRDKKPSSNSNGNKKPAAKDWKTKDWKAQGKGEKYCSLHGKGSHTTEECKTIQNKRFKNDRDGNPGYQKKAYGNKTWTKSADEGKSNSKKELNAIVKKAIAKGVRKELNAIQAKRKTDDSSDEEGEFNMLEQAFDLKDFNYADMENLKIEDDDEVTV